MMQPIIWTTFGYLYEAIIRQFFKGAYDVIAVTMATVHLSEKRNIFCTIYFRFAQLYAVFSFQLTDASRHDKCTSHTHAVENTF